MSFIIIFLVLVFVLILMTNKSKYEYYTNNISAPDILAPLKKLNLVVSHSNIMIIENNNVLLCETNYELVIYIISAKNGNSINKLNVTEPFEQIIISILLSYFGKSHHINEDVIATNDLRMISGNFKKLLSKDKFKDCALVDYGFIYHRDKYFAQDDVTWFLLEKRK